MLPLVECHQYTKLVEHETSNLRVAGSSPALIMLLSKLYFICFLYLLYIILIILTVQCYKKSEIIAPIVVGYCLLYVNMTINKLSLSLSLSLGTGKHGPPVHPVVKWVRSI